MLSFNIYNTSRKTLSPSVIFDQIESVDYKIIRGGFNVILIENLYNSTLWERT